MKAILLSGPAGSGKSTWAKNYAKTHPNTVVVSSDAIRYKLFGSYQLTREQENLVLPEMMVEAKEAAEAGKNCIIDVAVCKNRRRKGWYSRLRQYYHTIELVIINVPVDLALKQNLQRDRHVPEEVIKQMYSYFEEPDEEVKKLFSDIIYVERA